MNLTQYLNNIYDPNTQRGLALSAATTAGGLMAGAAIKGRYESPWGDAISGLSNVAGAIPGPWGAVAGAGLGILGGLANRMFGAKWNKENIAKVDSNINALKGFLSNAGTWDALQANMESMPGLLSFTNKWIGTNGWFNTKADDKANQLRLDQGNAFNWATRQVDNNAQGIGYNMYKLNLLNANAFGGPLQAYGADWNNNLIDIQSGGTHEQNPYLGVQVGVDPQGVPNLVEENELIWNGDYVFSNRLKVPQEFIKQYKLGGSLDATFADIARKVSKESEERPNDPISKKYLENMMTRLQEQQELVKALKDLQEAQLQMQQQMLLNALYQQAMMADGGNLFVKGGITGNEYHDIREIQRRYQAEWGRLGYMSPSSEKAYADVLALFLNGDINTAYLMLKKWSPQTREEVAALQDLYYRGQVLTLGESQAKFLPRYKFPKFPGVTPQGTFVDKTNNNNLSTGVNPEYLYTDYQIPEWSLLEFPKKLQPKLVDVNNTRKLSHASTNSDSDAKPISETTTDSSDNLLNSLGSLLNVFGVSVDKKGIHVNIGNTKNRAQKNNLSSQSQSASTNSRADSTTKGMSTKATTQNKPYIQPELDKLNYATIDDSDIIHPEDAIVEPVVKVTPNTQPTNTLFDSYPDGWKYAPDSDWMTDPYYGVKYFGYGGSTAGNIHADEGPLASKYSTINYYDRSSKYLAVKTALNSFRKPDNYPQTTVSIDRYGRPVNAVGKLIQPYKLYDINSELYSKWGPATAERNRQMNDVYKKTYPNTPWSWSDMWKVSGKADAQPDEEFMKYYNEWKNKAGIDALVSGSVNSITNNESDNFDPLENLRYIPAIGGTISAFTDLLGLTNKPDYTFANELLDASINNSREVRFNPIGNYLSYTPYDVNRMNNLAILNSARASKGIYNNGTLNRAVANIQDMINTSNLIGTLGTNYLTGLQYNDSARADAIKHNASIDLYNSTGSLNAQEANQKMYQGRIATAATAAQMKAAEKAQADYNRSLNLTNLFNSLGDIGREIFAMNQIRKDKSILYDDKGYKNWYNMGKALGYFN